MCGMPIHAHEAYLARLTEDVAALFDAYHELRLALEAPKPATWQYAVDDIRDQLAFAHNGQGG